MTTPTPPYAPDKVHISAYYDEKDGACHSIDVALNYDGISREDLTETIRAVFQPQPAKDAATFRHRELGSTDVIPVASRNGDRPNTASVPISSARKGFGR